MPEKRLIKLLKLGNSKTALIVVTVFTTVLMGAVFLAWHIRVNFWFELLVSYLPQIVIISGSFIMLIATLLVYRGLTTGWDALLRAGWKMNVLVGVALSLFLHNFFMPFLITTAQSDGDYGGPTLNVTTINKHYSNSDLIQIVNYVKTAEPDILAVEEIFRNEAEELAGKLGYTHWHMATCDCSAYGSDLALFSRFPMQNTSLAFEDRLGGVLRSEVTVGHNEVFSVYVTHIVPPYGSKAYSIRPQMLDQLALLVNEESNPVILVGDFSASLHAIDMRVFSDKIQDKILPVAERPWPKCSWFLLSELFCAKIDHIYIPTTSNVVFEEVGQYIGSDHRPVSVSISY